MKGWKMYTEIQSLKNIGFSRRQTAAKLGLSINTIRKYWDVDPDQFEKVVLKRKRRSHLQLYESVILSWITDHPDLSGAQVYDWLLEHYEVTFSERSTRRFVSRLRKKHGIPRKKSSNPRQYMAVEEPPMGRQIQVDFGEIHVQDVSRMRYKKLYCIGAVLAHSRYKWGYWQDRPFRAEDLVRALEECFVYFGGMARELVFDQDHLVAVSENYGEPVFTREFELFRQRMGFLVYLCRAADPESKGKVEAVVKFFKYNFARNRKYHGIDHWNEAFLEWLSRTGNAKIHGTTKKIPADVHLAERTFLKPVPFAETFITPIVTRRVRKDNTILYKGSRYQLPLGTYCFGREVQLNEKDGVLTIQDIIDPVILARYPLAVEVGSLVCNRHFRRDMTQTLDRLQQQLVDAMDGLEEAILLATRIRQLHPRYGRDQFGLILSVVREQPSRVWQQALQYCVAQSLYSAVDFRDAALYFAGAAKQELSGLQNNPKVRLHPAIQPEKRSLSEYSRLLEEGDPK